MRQVPGKKINHPYLIVGNGKLASHFHHYFNLLGIEHHQWYRQSTFSFQSLFDQSEKVLVLINDDAIPAFVQKNRPAGDSKIWVHCSGLLSLPSVESAHPLFSFSNQLYDLNTYKKIPFAVENSNRSFNEIFPEFDNPHFALPSLLKPLYHAWCVMSGNFSTILWERFFSFLKQELHQPQSIASPYFESIRNNLKNEQKPLTGPFTRKDSLTIEKHIKALSKEPFLEVYKAFDSIFKQHVQ